MTTTFTHKDLGFTLIETLVAVTILTVSIVAPMVLASQSLQSAYYARDQIIAENLAQEALEAVRQVRDGQILQIAKATDDTGIDLFGPIPIDQNFNVDPTASTIIRTCPDDDCTQSPLKTNGILYGYHNEVGWTNTQFYRTVYVTYVPGPGQITPGPGRSDEIRVKVDVTWKTQFLPPRTVTISENMYRWVNGGSGN